MDIVHGTEEILKDLNNHIVKKKPFSTIRLGDVGYGTIAYFKCPQTIKKAVKWKNGGIQRNVFHLLGVPDSKIGEIVDRIVVNANEANYIDSPAAYSYELKENNVNNSIGNLYVNWKEIHKGAGITNTSYCSALVHYFSIVEGEYNLFDIMKGRSVFCISNQLQTLPKLRELSDAKLIDHYKIPRRNKKQRHFKEKHYSNILSLIKERARDYDLFLIGAGLLARVYCGEVKKHGGRVFDSGRLFDFWSGKREIRGRVKWFLKMNTDKLLCERILGHGNKIW